MFGQDLKDVNLAGANLSQMTLGLGDFTRLNLRGASLTGTWIHSAILDHADFSNASMRGALIESGTVRGGNYRQADLIGTHFDDMDMRDTDFTGARMLATKFTDCDLRRAVGLESVLHQGPSTIGVDTIYKSRGDIADAFLRGCGVPDNLITFIPSLIASTEGLQFYSCFISYSNEDQRFARQLYARMRDAHLRVWFAPVDIKAGKKVYDQIDQAIRVHDKLLVVLSEHSLQSEWVTTEVRRAFREGRAIGKRKLFPLRLVDMDIIRKWQCFDADTGKDLAVELREYFIPDFSSWEDESKFDAATARLLNDLKSAT
jgi:hypothetical protein